MTHLELVNISKSFDGINLFKEVNFKLEKKETVCHFGSSGSGKSSLLQISAGILNQDCGSVFIMNKEIKNEQDILNARRNYLSFIFQFHNLIPELTVFENISIAQNICSKKDDEFINFLLNELGVFEKKHYKPQMLSGGEAQRISVIRAFATKPKIVFADEPTGSLDPKNAEKTIDLIMSLAKEIECSVLAVSHNIEFRAKFDRAFELKDCSLLDFKV
jgi:ABC-type lipoprotein export system ATPase subunit